MGAWRCRRRPRPLADRPRVAPRDADLVHNLAVARAHVDDAASEVRPPDPVPSDRAWMDFVTPGELGVLAWLLWLGASAAAWRQWRHRDALGPWIGASVLAAALSLTAWQGRSDLLSEPVAVLPDEVVRRDGPALEAGAWAAGPPTPSSVSAARRAPSSSSKTPRAPAAGCPARACGWPQPDRPPSPPGKAAPRSRVSDPPELS